MYSIDLYYFEFFGMHQRNVTFETVRSDSFPEFKKELGRICKEKKIVSVAPQMRNMFGDAMSEKEKVSPARLQEKDITLWGTDTSLYGYRKERKPKRAETPEEKVFVNVGGIFHCFCGCNKCPRDSNSGKAIRSREKVIYLIATEGYTCPSCQKFWNDLWVSRATLKQWKKRHRDWPWDTLRIHEKP